MKRIIPIFTILVIISILLLLPREKSHQVRTQQVLSVETQKPQPKADPPLAETASPIPERDKESFDSFLLPKDLQ